MGEIHPDVKSGYLAENPDAASWMRGLLRDFSVSWASRRRVMNADVSACILKPDPHLDTFLGLAGEEVLLVHSRYPDLQKRVLLAASGLFREEPFRTRVSPLFYVLASPAADLEEQVRSATLRNSEERTIVPFREGILAAGSADAFQARQVFSEWLMRRNLFDAHAPLKSELFYFGRQQFTNELINTIQNGHNFGLFGLRKTGKTSLLFCLERLLRLRNCKLHFVDGQDPAVYELRWWQLVGKISETIRGSAKTSPQGQRTPTAKNASDILREAIAVAKQVGGRKCGIVLAIDEIEHIAPVSRSAEHWDEDFLHFWRALRAVQSREAGFSVVICGVNSSVLETARYSGRDNPIYQFASAKYMPPLDRGEVREMVRTLARGMGIRLPEEAYDYLHARYGGHTFLTRMACKLAADDVIASGRLPGIMLTQDLIVGQDVRERALHADADNILELLRAWYKTEWDLLNLLARGDREEYDLAAAAAPRALQHLVSYGLVAEDGADGPRVRVPALLAFLRSEPHAPSQSDQVGVVRGLAAPLTDDLDLLAENGKARNEIERKLRRFVRRVLRTRHGDSWIRCVLECVPEEQRKLLAGVDADKILNDRLFLPTLLVVIEKNWANCFDVLQKAEKQLAVTKEAIAVLVQHLNANRDDAHAKVTSVATVASVQLAADALRVAIERYLDD